MTGHGKIADYQMCVLVLGQVVDCMSELLAQGQPVKLDGPGTFSPSVDGQKLGKISIEKAVEAGADAMINGIKINFTPVGGHPVCLSIIIFIIYDLFRFRLQKYTYSS